MTDADCHVVTFSVEKEKGEDKYSGTDMYNKELDPSTDTVMIHMADEVHPFKNKTKPFDWFICSVLALFLCVCTGISAMYYSVRANHALDWGRDKEMVISYTRKAKCLTLTSIIIGVIWLTFYIIMILKYTH